MQQKPQETIEEVLFIGDPSQQIQIHKHDTENNTLENTQILQCVFTFVRKDSPYSKALKGILIRLLCEFKSENIKELFYSDNEKGKFHIYIQADSNTILNLADTLSSKLPLGLDFTFRDIAQLSIDEFNSIKSSDCVMIQTSKNNLESSLIDSISTNAQNNSINNTQAKTLNSKQNHSLLIPNVDEMHALIYKDLESTCNVEQSETSSHTESSMTACHAEPLYEVSSVETREDFSLVSKAQNDKIVESTNTAKLTQNTPQLTNFLYLESINLNIIHTSTLNALSKAQMQHFIKYELIESLAKILLDNTKITLQRNSISFTLSLKNTAQSKKEIPFILFSTLDSAQSYLRMSEAQKSMLASFEKPFISIQCKEVFIKEFSSNTIFAGLSCDIIVLLLLSYLQKNHEISYLFYTPQVDFIESDSITQDSNQQNSNKSPLESKALLCYKDAYPYSYTDKTKMLESTYSVAEHIYLSHLQTHKNLSSLLTSNKAKSARFIPFLSTTHKSEFLIEKPQDTESSLQRILDISFSTDLYTHLETLHSYKNGDKLIANFTKANKDIVSQWNLTQSELEKLGLLSLITPSSVMRESKITTNLLDISLLIEQILGIESSVLEYASRCVRDRGPRIDYKLIRMGDSIVLDYARILRSVMSFQLAGVENELLCYGVIDSLAEFIGTLAGDMMLNYGIQEVFICGDLLLKQCFLDKIIKAIPKNMEVSFAKLGGTDYLDL
ncbi:hypothetical protein [Helicobacter bilis]|uniref:Protein hydE n=1 Tax=Helicobacter bilis TaxID=37372 RepID=A0A4U8UB43_9HELI|nr:hypothetical protein [Helicobacter bilis]MCI7411710.1 hypothetical protein [Helicobacter bilis]MDY4400566.1 hypothetical protein [Helicobacter bilis]TLE10200.1 hypothetical protein LS78_000410 [Helicobacter bilis]TLE12020.1 hypothetical protein LS79_001120 [Helicobacter bilis]